MAKRKRDYADEINRAFRKAAKERNEPAVQYYSEAFGGVACVSFERFKNSWAGQEWMKKRGFA